ncbi:MAG: hypothetical protein GY868_18530 [Deltaproteobacteria bacterium]|nr:hypothetical protein [Deltaproteobacteria bacterium]
MHVPVKKRLPQRMAALPPTDKKSPPQKEPARLQPALKKSPETFTAAPPDISPAQITQPVASVPELVPEQGPARVAPTPTQELLPYFTIQVDSFRNKILAEQHRLALLRNGFQAYLIKKLTAKGNVYFKLRVGCYSSRKQAQIAAANLQQINRTTLIITSRLPIPEK